MGLALSFSPSSLTPLYCMAVSLPICLPSYLSPFLSVSLPICLPSYLSPFLSVSLPICLPFYLSPFLSVSLPICLPSYLSPFLSVSLPICLSSSTMSPLSHFLLLHLIYCLSPLSPTFSFSLCSYCVSFFVFPPPLCVSPSAFHLDRDSPLVLFHVQCSLHCTVHVSTLSPLHICLLHCLYATHNVFHKNYFIHFLTMQ
jgi:hypothetical protein